MLKLILIFSDRQIASYAFWMRKTWSEHFKTLHLQKIKFIAHKEILIEELIILVNLWLLYIIGIETVPY